MPIEQRSVFQPLRAVAIAFLGVAIAIGIMVAMLYGTEQNNVLDFQLGDDRFNAGDATNQAEAIRRDGPILYPDLVGENRPIYLNHLGDDPQTGWVAFDAKVAEAEDNCVLFWDPDRLLFANSCDPDEVVYDDGGSQRAYPTSVDDDNTIWVDLNNVGDGS